MFGSRERQRREEYAAWAKQYADDHRKETEKGIRNASGNRHQKPDKDFIRNWGSQRAADQEYRDAEARAAAKRAKRWWQ